MKIKIADRTLCANETMFGFKEKIEIARQLEKLCVDVIELPKIEKDKTDILFIRTVASFVKNSVISVAVTSTEDVDKATTALSSAQKPRIRVELPVSCVGMEYSLHIKAPKMLEMLEKTVAYAKEKFDDVEFCAIDATRAEIPFLKDAIKVAKSAGAGVVTLCDTTAEILPDKFGEFIEKFKDDNVEIGVMCENNNGLAAADAVIAVKNGADIVKTAVGGTITPLETFAGIIKNCGKNCDFASQVKFTELNRIVSQINWVMNNVKNVKNTVNTVYSGENEIELDANDDKNTVLNAVLTLGYDLSEEDGTKVYDEFLRVSAKKRITAKELDAVVASVALQVPPTYKLVNYVVNSGNIITSTAQITLEKSGNDMQGISTGDGPIDAVFHAIEQITGCRYELDDFQIQSVTEGKEAMGSAVVKLRQEGKLYSGNGISTDIIDASIKAYINAVNKIVYEEM